MNRLSMIALGLVCLAAGHLSWILLHPNTAIIPPIQGANIPFDTLTFDASDGITYRHPTGTTIHLEGNALLHPDGKRASGEVTLLYREFHDAMDIFVSGIPMHTEDGALLQSAGMCEIKAMQGDDVLELTQGQTIDMQLAAFRDPTGYSLFRLDPGSSEWLAQGAPTLDTNLQKNQAVALLPARPEQPNSPIPADDDFVFVLEADGSNPQLKPFEQTKWQVVVNDQTDLVALKRAFKINWKQAKINTLKAEEGMYELALSTSFESYEGKQVRHRFSTIVKPVLEGEDLEAALAQFATKMAAHDELLMAVLDEEQRLSREADLLSTFQANQFGVWNVDKVMNNALFVEFESHFDFEDKINLLINPVQVFAVNHEANTVVKYRLTEHTRINVNPDQRTSLIAILPNDNVAVVFPKELEGMDLRTISSKNAEAQFNTELLLASEFEARYPNPDALNPILTAKVQNENRAIDSTAL